MMAEPPVRPTGVVLAYGERQIDSSLPVYSLKAKTIYDSLIDNRDAIR